MDKSKIVWVVDEYLLDNHIFYERIPQTIRDLGYKLHLTKYVPFGDTKDQDYGHFSSTDIVILYGTHGFVSKAPKYYFPGAYGLQGECNNWSYYTQFLYNQDLLNSDWIMTTWNEFQNNTEKFRPWFVNDHVFIRPNSGFKTFAGFVHDVNDPLFLSGHMQTTSVMPETLIVLSKPKKIQGEFRFVIVNKNVIAGSEYRWDNKLDIRADYPLECFELAQKVAKSGWQLDDVYVCDVAATESGPKIVELNSFACAGWYACDQKKIIDAVSKLAYDDSVGT